MTGNRPNIKFHFKFFQVNKVTLSLFSPLSELLILSIFSWALRVQYSVADTKCGFSCINFYLKDEKTFQVAQHHKLIKIFFKYLKKKEQTLEFHSASF